jgi:hypothetical protein
MNSKKLGLVLKMVKRTYVASLNSLLASSVVSNSGHDKKIWTATSDGSFSVKTCCALNEQTTNEGNLHFQTDV